ncbi:response regulator [Calothrix sp. PCC 6303]|uniref:response regulator n=1 Tax=Calothrix sp. PCC 6303 TaxID=1170562 RepID=UPI0002A00A28|nr:response regulator [Calothrix sp. PCC 6303]AFZ03826.1 multi-sensor hybrid histidine kinase [Calothrix sp. PCC 6303]
MDRIQRTVLVVDDNPEDCEMYRRYLLRIQEYNYTVVVATLGQEGLAQWRQYQPDAVLLDYRLPDMDGLEFLSALQAQGQKSLLSVIMVTGEGNEAIAVQAIKAGAQDYLVKGKITPEKLRLAVNATINSVGLQNQLQQRIERERVIAEISQKVYKSLELDDVLNTTVQEVRNFLQSDRVLVFHLESDGSGTVMAESVGAEWCSILTTKIYDPCLVESYIEQYRQGLVTTTTDTYDGSIDPCHLELLDQFQVRANLVVPILHEDQFWGLLIAHQCNAPRQWQPLETDLLQQLATQVSVAIRQAELYQQAQRELAERQRAEEVLRDKEEKLRLALEASQMVTWDWNILTNEIQWSGSETMLLELVSYDLWFSRLFPEDRDRVLDAINAAITTGVDYDMEFRMIYPDDSIRWKLSQGKVFYNSTGQPTRMTGINLDITDRKRSEAEIRQSEYQVRRILNNLFSFVGVMTPDGVLVEANRTALEAAALSPSDVLGKPFPDTYWWSYSPEIQAQLALAIQQAAAGEIVRYDVEVRLGEGKFIVIDFFLAPLFDDTGRVEYLIPSGIDITDRKLAQEALQKSEEFKNRVLESSSDCIKVLDMEGRLLYVNAGGMCLLEIDDLTPFLNTEWLCFWQDEYRQAATAAITQAKRGETAKFQGFCPTAKGTPKWWDVVVSPIRDSAGQVIQLLSVSRDMTEQKQAQASLQEQTKLLQVILSSIGDGLIAANQQGELTIFNEAAHSIFGSLLNEIPPNEWASTYGLFLPDQKTLFPQDEFPLIKALQGETVTDVEVFICNQQELEGRWISANGYPLSDGSDDIKGGIVVFRDITERKRSEIERDRILQLEQAARTEAERANRVKDEFLAVLSHELRSPLNPILGWTKLLQTRQFDADQTAKALATIERNAKLQTELIDDLLDIAKILRGKLNLNVAPVNLKLIIEAALDTVSTAATAKSILIEARVPPIGQVLGDATRLQQVIWNLISNAIKFTPSGGRIDIRLQNVDDHAQLTFTDTGKGINPDFIPHIFEAFRQEDFSVTRKHGGLGLGLAIVYSLVELHGGTISAASLGEGQGATFTVRLPLLKDDSQQIDELLEQEPDLTGIKILTVDDDQDSRELLTVLLMQYGAEVTALTSAQDVLSTLESSFQPDVLVSDIGMPDMDGYTLIRRIRALAPQQGGKVPAIALTSYARETDQQQALAAGFQRHIAKPIDPHQLAQAIVLVLCNSKNTSLS